MAVLKFLETYWRADRRGRFAKLDEVLQSCRQAGVAKVTLRTQREAGP